jgi:hypothetical protein
MMSSHLDALRRRPRLRMARSRTRSASPSARARSATRAGGAPGASPRAPARAAAAAAASAPSAPAPPAPPARAPPAALFNTHNFFTDAVLPFFGAAVLLAALPLLALQIALCTAWDAVDRRSLRLVALARRVAGWRGWEAATQHAGDGFIFPALLWLGVLLPALCVHEALHARAHGFSFARAAAYNLLRIGPMYKNFAHSYTLAHKEYHTFRGIFTKALNAGGLCYAFNWVAGPFFGILPGTFTHSHTYNHHKYNNAAADVYSTGGYARDSLWNFCRYIAVWFGYASNASTVVQFVREGRLAWAAQVVAATAYYAALVAALAAVSPAWAAASLGWAFVEGNILLAMVNWVWHAFIDPADPENEATNSTTIVAGEEFIFSEEYHVVHHATPGLHWARYEGAYRAGRARGDYKGAIVFQKCNLFVLGGTMLARDYAALAKHVHDPDGEWSAADLDAALKARLRHTIW